jgi:hypothetical protein
MELAGRVDAGPATGSGTEIERDADPLPCAYPLRFMHEGKHEGTESRCFAIFYVGGYLGSCTQKASNGLTPSALSVPIDSPLKGSSKTP